MRSDILPDERFTSLSILDNDALLPRSAACRRISCDYRSFRCVELSDRQRKSRFTLLLYRGQSFLNIVAHKAKHLESGDAEPSKTN